MELRQYQKDIAEQAHGLLRSFFMAYLCMEVRTGKTFTSFETARLYGARRVLFVTKLKAISSINKDYLASGASFSLFVINFESLHKVLPGELFDLVICDEAHKLGQYPKMSTAAKELQRIAKGLPIIYLSGTPTPESFSQSFHQFAVSSFSPWKDISFYKWHKEFGIPKTKFLYNRQIADYSQVKEDLVKAQLNKIMISYTQEEAGFDMPVEEHIIRVPMSEKIRWAIDRIRKDKMFKTRDGGVVLADTAAKEMQKIHQLCGGSIIREDKTALVFDWTKADALKQLAEGKKIAIFYKFVAEETIIRAMFPGRITGDPVDFNASEDLIFIAQFQSGREGINLSTADALVMYNIDHSALSYWQARARLQTLDRKKAALVYWLFTEGGLEEKIYNVVLDKKDYTTAHYKRESI